MAFFQNAITLLQTIIILLGAGLALWGLINLMEGYGGDNPGAKSQGIKQLMAGGGIALIGIVLVPQLSSLIIFRAILSAVRPFRLSSALIRTCIHLI